MSMGCGVVQVTEDVKTRNGKTRKEIFPLVAVLRALLRLA